MSSRASLWTRRGICLEERHSVTQFSDLGLSEVLLRALQHEGYVHPTPIQAQAIPSLLQGRDLLGIAQTGTGKTAAFALPILDRLLRDKQRPAPRGVRALVLAPTRELAVQITDSFRTYGRFGHLSVATVVGGVSSVNQIKALARGVDVLVATPGRLLDHLSTGNVRLDATQVVVLDEADHMLDLGFIIPIRQIISRMPKDRQSLFFSATMPKEIAGLAADFLRDPVEVKVTPVAATAERVAQEVYLVDAAAKRGLLVELLAQPAFQRTIVFARTKHGADKVTQHLEAAGIPSAAIHGNKSQGQRQRALDAFKAGRTQVLVATDIAARGIDVDNVSHVVNFELPDVPETYVHRIGRTARAGAEGKAVSLCDDSEKHLLRAIERLTRQTLSVTDRRTPGAHRAEPADRQRQRPNSHEQKRHPQRANHRGAPQAKPGQPGRPTKRPAFRGRPRRNADAGQPTN
jgi:ATP-dependent RNA helicase RhlE